MMQAAGFAAYGGGQRHGKLRLRAIQQTLHDSRRRQLWLHAHGKPRTFCNTSCMHSNEALPCSLPVTRAANAGCSSPALGSSCTDMCKELHQGLACMFGDTPGGV